MQGSMAASNVACNVERQEDSEARPACAACGHVDGSSKRDLEWGLATFLQCLTTGNDRSTPCCSMPSARPDAYIKSQYECRPRGADSPSDRHLSAGGETGRQSPSPNGEGARTIARTFSSCGAQPGNRFSQRPRGL